MGSWQRSSGQPNLGHITPTSQTMDASTPATAPVVSPPSKEVERDRKEGKLHSYVVHVPRPYPGVQYRSSRRLDDRLPLYAMKGAAVEGLVDDEGAWLRVVRN